MDLNRSEPLDVSQFVTQCGNQSMCITLVILITGEISSEVVFKVFYEEKSLEVEYGEFCRLGRGGAGATQHLGS